MSALKYSAQASDEGLPLINEASVCARGQTNDLIIDELIFCLTPVRNVVDTMTENKDIASRILEEKSQGREQLHASVSFVSQY